MKITKKKLLSLLSENINLKDIKEMEFSTEDRPHEKWPEEIEQGKTPYEKVPMPDNMIDELASERYEQVVNNVRHYVSQVTGRNFGPMRGEDRNFMQLAGLMTQLLMDVIRKERAHRGELEQLAVDLVKKHLSIPEGALQFDAKIVGIGEISKEGFNTQQQDQQQDENAVDIEKDLFNELEQLSLEKAKRRFINGIIQGASDKGHYMYHDVANELTAIFGSSDILSQYGVIMSVNDTLYWQLGPQSLNMTMSGPMAGREDVDNQTDPPTIRVRGVTFPVLIHELIKGVLEFLSEHGMPEDEETWKEVEKEEDTLEKENWDLRIGPAIWSRLRNMYPDDIIENEDQYEIQNYLLMEIFKLPPKKFFVLMREVLLKTERGQQMMNNLVTSIHNMLNDEEYEEETETFQTELDLATSEINYEDMQSFLKSIGIDIELPDDFDVMGGSNSQNE